MRKMKYTIKDIAKITGYSVATISRVLSGKEGVSEEKRKEILKIIEQLGYIPNQSARRLRSKETKNILVMIPDIENYFYNKLIKGIETEVREKGYNIILGDFSDSQEIEEEYYRMMKGQIADGILIVGSMSQPQRIVEVSRQFPMVVISDYFSDELVTVCIDNFKAAYDATMFLYKCGYRRIAKITGKIGAVLSQDRLKGYRIALENLGLEFNERYIKYGDFKYESGYRLAKELLKIFPPPDAIFCSNDEMAIGACDAAKELGFSIPEELGIMGFDDIELSSMVTPKITTVHQPRYEMGKLAAQLLINILAGEEVSKGKYILDTSIIPKESTKNANITK